MKLCFCKDLAPWTIAIQQVHKITALPFGMKVTTREGISEKLQACISGPIFLVGGRFA